jgi:hypothetical protein
MSSVQPNEWNKQKAGEKFSGFLLKDWRLPALAEAMPKEVED